MGDLEKKNSTLTRKPEDEYWGEEAGRRFAIQQEELVDLRDENSKLKHTLTMMGEFLLFTRPAIPLTLSLEPSQMVQEVTVSIRQDSRARCLS